MRLTSAAGIIVLIVLAQTGVATEAWPTWSVRGAPVLTGHDGTASDPSVVLAAGVYHMAYTELDYFNPAGPRAVIALATSTDGVHWTRVASAHPRIPGTVLSGREGQWDENLETASLVFDGSLWRLAYCGYLHTGSPLGYPAAMAEATSLDCVTFTRTDGGAATVSPTADGYDNDAVYSPTIVPYAGGWAMVYTGQDFTGTTISRHGVRLLGATSSDGHTWIKRTTPVLESGPSLPAWTVDGVAESALAQDGTGTWWLFFTGLVGQHRVIGQARSTTPFGPWEVDPTPIVNGVVGTYRERALAPSVIFEGTAAHLWFLGTDAAESAFATGLATTTVPTIGSGGSSTASPGGASSGGCGLGTTAALLLILLASSCALRWPSAPR